MDVSLDIRQVSPDTIAADFYYNSALAFSLYGSCLEDVLLRLFVINMEAELLYRRKKVRNNGN